MSYQGITRPDYAEHIARLDHATNARPAPPADAPVTCTDADHEALRTEVTAVATRHDAGITTARGHRWWDTRRSWHIDGESLTVGECSCGSTIAIDRSGR